LKLFACRCSVVWGGCVELREENWTTAMPRPSNSNRIAYSSTDRGPQLDAQSEEGYVGTELSEAKRKERGRGNGKFELTKQAQDD